MYGVTSKAVKHSYEDARLCRSRCMYTVPITSDTPVLTCISEYMHTLENDSIRVGDIQRTVFTKGDSPRYLDSWGIIQESDIWISGFDKEHV